MEGATASQHDPRPAAPHGLTHAAFPLRIMIFRRSIEMHDASIGSVPRANRARSSLS